MIDEWGHNQKREPHRFRWADRCKNSGVITWADHAREVQLWSNSITLRSVIFDPTTTDCGPLVAYCEGHMPAYAFADWLEEQVSDFPPEWLAILRERAEGE